MLNIFQSWRELGESVPFVVRRANWSGDYDVVVQKIEIGNWPYGKAYGWPRHNGVANGHFEYNRRWKKAHEIPNAGSFQWSFVSDQVDQDELAQQIADWEEPIDDYRTYQP